MVGQVSPVVDRTPLGRAAEAVRFAGYVEAGSVKTHVAACDVFLNLRYPTAGETSASLLRLMGWGKPVIVTDYGQFR